jgi:hypothetical protein
MTTFPMVTEAKSKKLTNERAHEPDSNDVREIVHQLMNQLTIINLCVFQLSSTAGPASATPLATLERTVEHATRTAKRLSAQINQPNTCHPGNAQRVRRSRTDKQTTFTASQDRKTLA